MKVPWIKLAGQIRLQWGREHALTEIFHREERGNLLVRASMGPRACAHGNAAGVTACRGRRIRFNGAASMRSRKCYELYQQFEDMVLLQWGREHALTEIRTSPWDWATRAVLQWGREHALTEISPLSGEQNGNQTLQWGREHALTEMAQFRYLVARTRDGLQWGREHALTEILHDLVRGVGLVSASMGPRACAHGNAGRGHVRVAHLGLLQWGREHALTEMNRVELSSHQARSFNGAASMRSRKSAAIRRIMSLIFTLQWGREHALTEIEKETR